ncbi:MAG: cellobiose phosphorylase, partial [Tenericutes bacterium HGW-Tenericutes-8]
HLMVHGDLLHVSENVMATTNFMFGVFGSHIVLGNTSFNKFLGDIRNPLNVQKISGQRIYIKKDGVYKILSVPSYYEMGGTSTRWYYELDDDSIIVDVFVDINHAVENLRIYSVKGRAYDILITQQILTDVNEYMGDISYHVSEDKVVFNLSSDTMAFMKYPNLKYMMTIGKQAKIISESEILGVEEQHGLFVLSYEGHQEVNIKIQATFDQFEDSSLTYQQADDQGTKYFKGILKNFNLEHAKDQANMDKLNDILFWYTHNALVHYASPHGLEQYNGAAWGTRDVCQGPIELFTAANRFDIIREIILKVYKRQFLENGDFPQWFMFDKFYQIQAHESHGDIIIWPLRALGYYLQATEDFSILEEKVAFMSMTQNSFTEDHKMIEHLRKQMNTIVASFIPGTFLPRYGGGDWDDTLQPANHDLTTRMVSGWTVALLYESLSVLGNELKQAYKDLSEELLNLATNIKNDYMKYMIVDGIPAGFVVFEDDKKLSYLLHPRDQKTGLKYRLLPFIRSMISELADNEVIDDYIKLIDQVFMHPDGVRLMDTAVKYEGGKKTFFARAETAANFGREIGLQYVHAHIRYIESMAKIGMADRVYDAIYQIIPINMTEHVKNAEVRQSNMYFSSSDADFNDRYEAKRDFERVRKGDIKVKGGWRLYSSGPGIFIHQIVHHILGVGTYHQHLHLDPVIDKELDGMTFSYHFKQKNMSITYHYGPRRLTLNGLDIENIGLDNKYRKSGFLVDPTIILDQDGPIHIEVWTK